MCLYRLVGALLILCPEYCFVAEDDNGVCGYLVAALDAKKFWTKYEIAYLPDLLQKYERPSDTEQGMTEPQVCNIVILRGHVSIAFNNAS